MCRLSRNSGASTSGNPKGLSRPVAGKLSFTVHEGKFFEEKPKNVLIIKYIIC
jgi:hypothetical protein